VKRGLLSLHFFNEFFDPLICQRVRYSGDKASIVLDLLVEFDALLTHAWFRSLRVHLLKETAKRLICFIQHVERISSPGPRKARPDDRLRRNPPF
jgi:hypothetical protein